LNDSRQTYGTVESWFAAFVFACRKYDVKRHEFAEAHVRQAMVLERERRRTALSDAGRRQSANSVIAVAACARKRSPAEGVGKRKECQPSVDEKARAAASQNFVRTSKRRAQSASTRNSASVTVDRTQGVAASVDHVSPGEPVQLLSDLMPSTHLYGKLVALYLDAVDVVVPLLGELQQIFGQGVAWELAQSDWLVAWPRWDNFAEEFLIAAGRCGGGSLSDPVSLMLLRELLFALQRFVRNRSVGRLTDQGKIDALRALGFEWSHGEIWGKNNCLADSILQLLIKHGLVASEVDRKAACWANRVAIENKAELVPRRQNGSVWFGGYLQHHRHAEAIIRFFFDRFRCRAADLPAAGFVVYCHANYDDNDHPPDQVLVCEGLGVRVGPPLHFHLFNWVGSGCDGYHYDPLWLTNAALDLTVADASGDVQQEVNTAPLLPPAASASGPTIPGSATAGTGVTFAQAGPDHVPADPPRPVRRRIGQQIDRRRLLQRRRSMADDVCDELPLSFVQLVLSDTENDGADNVGLPRVRRVLRRAESEVSIGAADDLLATRLADAFTPGDLGACSEVTASETSLPRASEGTSASLSLRQGDSSERPRWKQFTPERIDQTGRICLARVWGSGRGAQCSRSPQQQELVSGLCVMHERERVKFGVPRHGFIHDDIPHEKWVDFVKAAGKCQRDHL
jgi:hypothetical protein